MKVQGRPSNEPDLFINVHVNPDDPTNHRCPFGVNSDGAGK